MVSKIVFTFILLLSIVSPSFAEKAGSPKTLKAGVVVSLTGDAAMSGEAMRKGIELARAELESKGWNVDLAWQDGETKPSKVVSSIQFLSGQGYRLLIGPTWSFEINAAKTVLEQSGSVTIAPAGSSDINGLVSTSIFNLCPLRSRATAVLADWLKSRPFKKAYVLVPSGDWGVVHKAVFLDALKSAGVTNVDLDEYDYGWTPAAFKALLLRRKASGADLILTTGAGSDLANMLKVRRDLHWSSTFVATEDLWDAIDMKLVSSSSPELQDSWVLGLPLSGPFFDQFAREYHESPKVYADRGFDALMLLAKAVEAGGPGSEAVKNFFVAMPETEGASGPIKFNAAGDRVTGGYKVMPAFKNEPRV